MYAVVKTGGKQYRVAPDQKITVERLPGEAGDKIEISEVLLVVDDQGVKAGAPRVEGVAVSAEIVEQKRGPKVLVFKKRRRQNSRRMIGHRQDLTVLKITAIGSSEPAAQKKKAAPKKAAVEAKE